MLPSEVQGKTSLCPWYRKSLSSLFCYNNQLWHFNLFSFPAGIEELQEILKMDHYSSKLSELCTKRCNQLYFPAFESAGPLLPMLTNFYTMNNEYSNYFFSVEWKKQLKAAEQPLKFEDVVHNVWNPTFLHCKQLYNHLENRTLSLAKVNLHFRQYENETAELQYHLKRLAAGISKCLGKPKALECFDDWVKERVILMQEYWSLVEYAEVARLFIQLQKNFHLTGSFAGVECLYSTVSEYTISGMISQLIVNDRTQLIDALCFANASHAQLKYIYSLFPEN